MSFFTRRQVILVPASKVDEFNVFMERNGYGPAMLVPREDNKFGAATDAKEKTPTHYSLEIASADDGIIAAIRKALAKCNDKLPKAEQGIEKMGFKIPEQIKGGGKAPVPSVTADSLAAEAGLKKKVETKPVDEKPVDGKLDDK